MGDRGRKPASELSIADNVIQFTPRPKAPEELTPDQAIEWDAVVNRLPADWFPRETHAVLVQYCRHTIAARVVANLVKRMDALPLKEDGIEADEYFAVDLYDHLLKMQDREGRALSSLATRLRITQQTTYDKSKKKGIPGKKPWDK